MSTGFESRAEEAYAVEPVGGAHPAEPLAEVVTRLRAECEGLRRAMHSRALIEQAKGVLIGRHRITEEEAFGQLSRWSQRSNTKLVRVAAAVVAGATPETEDGAGRLPLPRQSRRVPVPASAGSAAAGFASPRSGSASTPVGVPAPRPRPGPAAGPAGPDGAAPQRAEHLIVLARVAGAGTYDEIVAAVVGSAPPPDAVVLLLTEPDGALRLLASHGLTAETASQWRRIPPQVDLPVTLAVRERSPVWLPDPAAARRFPLLAALGPAASTTAALPLARRGQVLGVLGLAWRAPVVLDPGRRRRLEALADRVAVRLHEFAEPSGRAAGHLPPPAEWAAELSWSRVLLSGSLTAAAVLAPVVTGDRVSDFRFLHVNEAGANLAGTTVLTAFPQLGARVLVPGGRAVLADGRPRGLAAVPVHDLGPATPARRMSLRAARLSGHLLVSWRVLAEAELHYPDLVAAERMVDAAAFRWSPGDRAGAWWHSPHLPALLGWPASAGQLTLAAAGRLLDPADRAALRRLLAGVWAEGGRGAVTVLAPARRWLRVVATRDDGTRPTLRGALLDVTGLRVAQHRRPGGAGAGSGSRPA